ncbi:ABC-2 type transport system ATP-binding protein [Natranaerovirga pectinivora]|uniref:ABC-2 type transport system ATP-binding protein n=1 Tax=Natranaerovirga pectinivora TaxID=682400 RepID=A0A4R3MRQ2_9FIRM|nr:ABC transporter ATP-binding protein [Natranaerovirga pectinivora]TCT16088.1 ABC-2 type transport system ATP-binding protein [Natranaerovirga pectinivora]
MDSIISMKNVCKKFKDKTAIKNMTFDIKEGEIFGFLGPSGAGKTTTIKILTAQLIATSGQVKVLGKDIHIPSKEVFKEIGVLSDNSALYERLTVQDNLLFYAEINGVNKKNSDEILEQVGLLESKKKEVKKLSKGMKQRLNLARAVLNKPRLLFLDEPTSSLDPSTMVEIHKLLRKLNKEGTTIFLTTHNMEEADKLCNRVAFLNEGEIVEIGKPSDIKLKYRTEEIKVILKNNPQNVIIKNDEEGGAQINAWMKKGQLLSIHSMEPNLEQIFLRLTGREL